MNKKLRAVGAAGLAAATVITGLGFGPAAASAVDLDQKGARASTTQHAQLIAPLNGGYAAYDFGATKLESATYPTRADALAHARWFTMPQVGGTGTISDDWGNCLVSSSGAAITWTKCTALPAGKISQFTVTTDGRIAAGNLHLATGSDGVSMTPNGGGTYFTGDAFGLPFTVVVDARDAATQTAELSGSAVPGAVVLVNGTQQVTADATTGAWKATVSGLQLGETNHVPVAEYVIQAGQPNKKQDRTADVNFEITNLTAEVNPGTVTTDAEISGVAEPGSVVEARNSAGELVASAPAQGPLGSYTMQIPAPNVGGDYALTMSQVFAKQTIGNVPVTIHYGAPVAVSTPADQASHAGGPLIMSGTGVSGSKIQVTDKAAKKVVGSADVLVNNGWNLTTEDLDEFEHTLVVTQTSAGKNVTSQEITINPGKSDIAQPTATVRFDTDVSKKATVSGTGAEGATITLKNGTTPIGTATVENGKWSTQIDPIGPREHTLTIEQTGISGTQTTTTTADFGAGVAINGPAGTITPGVTNVTGTTQLGATVQVQVGDETIDAAVKGTTWSAAVEFPPSNDQTTVTAIQHSKGALETTSHTIVTPNGAQAHTPVAITSPANGQYEPGARTVVSGTATPYATVVVKNQFGATIASTKADSAGAWSFARQYGPAAVYKMVATQTRFDGSTSTSAEYVLSPDRGFQKLTLTTPDTTSVYTPGKAVLFSGKATPGATIVAKSSWGSTMFTTRANQTDGSWATTRAFGPTSQYVLTMTQTALNGQTDSVGPIVLNPPTHKDVTLTSPKNGDKYTPGQTVAFTGEATPNATIAIKSKLTGSTYKTGTAGPDGHWTINRAWGPTAVYNFDIVATDPDGKTTSTTELLNYGPATN